MWHWDLEFCDAPGFEGLMHDSVMLEKYCLDARVHLDFWRIDTKYGGAKWFQDPAFNGWQTFEGEDISHRYVCTPRAVSPSSLQLFKFESSLHDSVIVRKLDGVSHCSYNPLPLRMVS